MVLLKKEVTMNFSEAVRHAEKTITEKGFSILLTKSIDEILKKKLGLREYPRYTVILACAPELAKMALDVSKDVGSLFPCSFVIYEEDHRVFVSHLSIMKTAVEIGLVPADQMETVIQKTAEKIERVWKRL